MSAGGLDAGVDLGATLAKVVLAPSEGPISTGTLDAHLFPAADVEELARFLSDRRPATVGATGAGARAFASRLGDGRVRLVDEFGAWAAGERLILTGAGFTPSDPHLLVSIGTGTSMLRVANGTAARVGGTALGGGTLSGLGALLSAEREHEALVARAAAGDSRRVDLLVSDLYRKGEIPIDVDLTAASFGRILSRSPEDLAAAVARLVGENVALLAGAWAAAHGAEDVVYAGSTLRGNELLKRILAETTALSGRRALFLPMGEFAGAAGALALARAAG